MQDQIIADEALQPWNRRAPPPRIDESRHEYRCRLARIAARYLPPDHELKNARLDECEPSVARIFFPKIMAEVKSAVDSSDTVPNGQLRQIDRLDATGRKITTFVGRESFVKAMQAPSKRVTQFARLNGTFAE
jgi:hypothetical protein